MIEYRGVVRELGRARDDVLGRFRAQGCDADRWERRDRVAMSEALTRVEDALELGHPRWAEREALRGVRRGLEVELEP